METNVFFKLMLFLMYSFSQLHGILSAWYINILYEYVVSVQWLLKCINSHKVSNGFNSISSFLSSHFIIFMVKSSVFKELAWHSQGRNEPLLIRGVSARVALPKPIMPCSKFLFLATIFPKNCRRGEGGWGGENFFCGN
jgi:hypothetical protein